jgi:hypothetical protein
MCSTSKDVASSAGEEWKVERTDVCTGFVPRSLQCSSTDGIHMPYVRAVRAVIRPFAVCCCSSRGCNLPGSIHVSKGLMKPQLIEGLALRVMHHACW